MSHGRRLCLAVDAVGYSSRSIPGQRVLQQSLRAVLDTAWSGIDAQRQANGDGEVAIAPAGNAEAALLAAVLGRLHGALHQVDGLRLRVAAHAGHTEQGANGFVGHAVVRACRLVAAQALRRALAEHPEHRMALLVSDSLFEDAISQDVALQARAFAPVEVADPATGFTARAYLHLPGLERVEPAAAVHEARMRVDVGPGGQAGTVVQVAQWNGDLRIELPRR